MIKRRYTFPVGFHGTIFDVETTGLDPQKDELLAVGYFSAGELRILQRDRLGVRAIREIKDEVRKLNALQRPYFSYNKEFEEKWLGLRIDHDMMDKWKKLSNQIQRPGYMWCRDDRWVRPEKSLCPECGGILYETIKWPSQSELISLPQSYFFQSDIDGRDVPRIWKQYVRTGNRSLLDMIMFHNFNDLIRSYCLYVWDETVADLIGTKLKKSSRVPRSVPEIFARSRTGDA